MAERAALSEPELATQVVFDHRSSEPGTSRFRVRLPASRLPLVALDIDCGGGHLLRPVRVLEPRLSGEEVQPVSLGSGTLRREVQGELHGGESPHPDPGPRGRRPRSGGRRRQQPSPGPEGGARGLPRAALDLPGDPRRRPAHRPLWKREVGCSALRPRGCPRLHRTEESHGGRLGSGRASVLQGRREQP